MVTFLFTDIEGSTRRWENDADGMQAALRRAVPPRATPAGSPPGPAAGWPGSALHREHGNPMLRGGVGVVELAASRCAGLHHQGRLDPGPGRARLVDTGDLGYIMENGHVVVCGRVKDVIIMAGRSIYPTDVERAAGRVEGVRPGCAVALRLDAGHSRESFAVAVESNAFEDPAQVRRIKHQVAHEVVAEVDMRPRDVVGWTYHAEDPVGQLPVQLGVARGSRDDSTSRGRRVAGIHQRGCDATTSARATVRATW